MDVHVLSAPAGFTAAVVTANRLAGAGLPVLKATAADVLRFVKHAAGGLSPEQVTTQLEAAGVTMSTATVKGVIDALVYLLRGATAHGADRDTFYGACATHTDLEPEVLAALGDVLAAGLEADAAAAAAEAEARAARAAAADDGDGGRGGAGDRVLTVGNFVGVEWKLGVTVESSHCVDVSAPFVTLVLKVADTNGRVSSNPIELSFAEFKLLSNSLQEVATVMDSM